MIKRVLNTNLDIPSSTSPKTHEALVIWVKDAHVEGAQLVGNARDHKLTRSKLIDEIQDAHMQASVRRFVFDHE